jgi:hypothetical protein
VAALGQVDSLLGKIVVIAGAYDEDGEKENQNASQARDFPEGKEVGAPFPEGVAGAPLLAIHAIDRGDGRYAVAEPASRCEAQGRI